MDCHPLDRPFDMLNCYLAKEPSVFIKIPYCEIANGNIVKLETSYFDELEGVGPDIDPTFITFVHIELDGVVQKIEAEEFCKEMEKQLGRGKFSCLEILPVAQEPQKYIRKK
jgi:hypothetical protein